MLIGVALLPFLLPLVAVLVWVRVKGRPRSSVPIGPVPMIYPYERRVALVCFVLIPMLGLALHLAHFRLTF